MRYTICWDWKLNVCLSCTCCHYSVFKVLALTSHGWTVSFRGFLFFESLHVPLSFFPCNVIRHWATDGTTDMYCMLCQSHVLFNCDFFCALLSFLSCFVKRSYSVVCISFFFSLSLWTLSATCLSNSEFQLHIFI